MIKGEKKREEIILTAETLFCKQGYEKTGIQEIIDLLHTSKGSLYHHFTSKESLLEEICRRRVQKQAELVYPNMSTKGPASDNLNTLFSGMMPLESEKVTFLLMLLPVFELPEGRNIISSYCEALTNAFWPMISDQLISGTISGECYCTDAARSAKLCCLLLNNLWVGLCTSILHDSKVQREIDYSELLADIDLHRDSLEKMITLPFGTLKLIGLPELQQLIRLIQFHWNRT